jgi:hypothetical protein
VDSEGRVSPDGRYLSYTDWDSGDLALHEIATGTDRRLTDTKQKKRNVNDVFAAGSAISRDGKQIAYNWFDYGNHDRASAPGVWRGWVELRLASLTGDPNPRRLYHNPDVNWFFVHDWSPDGKWVAVEVARQDRTRQIGLVSVQDGSLRLLKSIDWRGAGRIFFSSPWQMIRGSRSPLSAHPAKAASSSTAAIGESWWKTSPPQASITGWRATLLNTLVL